MDYGIENNPVKMTNLYHEHMPAIRFIGKRYTSADLNADGQLMDKWNEWFQNGWFNLLSRLPGLPGYEGVAHTGYHNGSEMSFWIGIMFPQDTPAPDGFDTADLPAGDMAVCWLSGYRETGELYTPATRNLCLSKIREAGYATKIDFDGEPCKWTFERYHHQRFFMPDDEGRITMDYCVYVVAQEQEAKAPLTDDPEQIKDNASNRTDNSAIAHTEPLRLPTPEMKIANMSPYSVDVESNLLLCAMTTLFLKLNNCDNSTPFFCSRNNRICNNCKDCGDRMILARHHLDLYHFLVSVTGVGLMYGDPNDAGEYDLKYIQGITPPLSEDRLDLAMKAGGFEYTRLDKLKGEQEIFRLITESLRRDKPVLMKLVDGPEWCIATGFDRQTNTIYGLDAKDHYAFRSVEKRNYTEDGLFIITDWFKHLHKAVIVTKKSAQAMNFYDLVTRMAGQLTMPERNVLQSIIPQMIDSITVENARGVADYFNRISGYTAEARWHGAECFGSLLLRKTEDETVHAQLRECMNLYFNTHDTCWQIWGQMGVGPHTNYKLPNHISQMMLDSERKERLKDLFAQVFSNDLSVLAKLQDIRERITAAL